MIKLLAIVAMLPGALGLSIVLISLLTRQLSVFSYKTFIFMINVLIWLGLFWGMSVILN